MHPIPVISEREKIPAKFLEQILLTLRHAGIVASKRGAGGGYFLEEIPERLRVWDVVRVMEEFPTPGKSSSRSKVDLGALEEFLNQLAGDLQTLLCATTLEDLLKLERKSHSASFDI